MDNKNIISRIKTLFYWVFLSVLISPVYAEDTPPNIVLILSDDHAWYDYGFMGHPIVKTPSLDKLARDGLTFKGSYVPTALCRPSLATIATGYYASTIGITGNTPAFDVYGKKGSAEHNLQREKLISKIDNIDTLPQLLKSKGYVSFQSGKWWEGSYKRGGFDEGMTRGFPEAGGRHGDDGLKIGREGMEPVTSFIDRALNDKKPFLVWYAPYMPHSPHNPIERIYKKYKDLDLPESVKKYYAMIEWFDETNGILLKHLEDKGVKDNTIIVYVSDNGWISNPDRLNSFLPRSKQSPSEAGVRTPIIFSWPKKLKPQSRHDLISSIDIVPTLLGAVGLPIPKDMPGLNLMDNMLSETPINRKEIFGEGFAHDIADLDDPEGSLLYRWIIEGDWKLILSYDGKTDNYRKRHTTLTSPQLFHLATDEHEQNNLIDQYPDVAQRLAKKIEQWYPLKTRKIIQ
ncbi:sulfatase [Pseudoalteromonas sp. S1727]|uniref:sulfatase family protein n=1 Tax=Pseudoalteromonas sp. S1727 TaxID=2066514 RepID=UPI0011081DC5|nr:sulfatase [Pseudoalteromonas sp. S1727]TMN74172.1 sulfatase [Pseudoalteromonas sp. S1727]